MSSRSSTRRLTTGGAALAALVVAVALAPTARTSPGHLAYTSMIQSAPEQSSNWAGFVTTSADPTTPITFTNVTATWREPDTYCGENDSDSSAAFWIGLGGYSQTSQALEQIGVSSDCLPTGPPSYYAWYELVPNPPISFAMAIGPGDVVSASVHSKGQTMIFELRDRTRGTAASMRAVDTAPDLTSADWIAEAPSSCSSASCVAEPIANFSSVAFSQVSVTGNGHVGALADPTWTSVPVQLVPTAQQSFWSGPLRGNVSYDSTAGTCLPSTTTAAGTSFKIAWNAQAANC